jgi:hypothetical protein
VGLVSLVVSELEPIRVFGFHAAIGVMLTLAMLFLVIPGIFERWPIVPSSGAAERTMATEDACARFMVRHAGSIAWIGMIVMAVAAVGIPRIRASVSIETLFTPASRVIRDYAWLEESIGPLVPVEVVLRFPDDSPLRPAERLDMVREVGEALSGMPAVSGVLSAATFLPDLDVGSGLRGQATRSIAARKLQQSLSGLDDMRIVRNVDGEQLWRVTARTSALSGIDFGDFLGVVRSRIDPIIAAHGGPDRGVIADYTGAMPLISTVLIVLRAPKDREHVIPAPTPITERCPVIVVTALPAHVDHGVNGGTAAEHLAAGVDDLAPVEPRVGLSAKTPIRAWIVDREQVADRNVDPGVGIRTPRFDQKHAIATTGGKTVSQHTTGGTRAHDHVIKRCLRNHARLPLFARASCHRIGPFR